MKKCCILSLELSPKRYLNWMVIQNNRSSHIDDDMIDKTFNFFGNNLYVINKTGEIDKELLFDVFKFAARKYGIKFFVIDSLMRIKFNHRYELNEQKDFIGDCKDFSTEFDCHVFIITHPRKGDGRNYKPNKMDIYGSSNIPNLTDNVLALWRPEDGKEDFDAELFVQKNREFGKQDSIKFLFNDDHKLYIEL